MPTITVQIADREEARRMACIRLLQPQEGIQVVGEARDGKEAVTAAAELKPHILLLSFNLMRGKEFTLLSTLHQKSPRTKVILLTRSSSEFRILEALSYGAAGYIDERAINTFLLKAVRLVDAGDCWVPRRIVGRIVDRIRLLTGQQEMNGRISD